jgi:ATP-binding cassette subfamily B protein
MKRLTKYLVPYMGIILMTIALLFGQANCDLALPDYMSRIVNIGIQQGGVEDTVPTAMRQSTMGRLVLTMDEGSAKRLSSDYAYLLPGTDAAKKYVGKYPAVARESVRVLRNQDKAERMWLSGTLRKSFVSAQAVKDEYLALGMSEASIQRGYMLKTGGMMLALALLSAVAAVLVGYLSSLLSAGLARDLRSAVFAKVEGFSQREFDQFSTASLITRTNNDVMQVQTIVVMLIRSVVYPPLIGVGGIIHALGKNASMWWVIALAVVVLVSLVAIIFKIAVPRLKIARKLIDRLTLVSRERLTGMMISRAFNTQEIEEGRFDGANKDLTKNSLFVNRVMAFMMPTMMLVMNGVSLLIIWIGSEQVAQSAMRVGDMMAFMQYAMQIVMAFLMMSMIFVMLPSAAVSADRVADILETEASLHDPVEPESFDSSFTGTVEFRDVCFKYPNAEEDALHDISFTARSGQTTAIIGATGAGKTSIVNLVPRFYDVSSGSVLVGEVDVRKLGQGELREKIGYVPQKASLFSGTIESNLRFADENASEEELSSSSAIAQVSEFIDSSPQGMATAISQGGDNVSGGQRQRLSIARALVKKQPVLIFDDCFSALDFKTDSALRRALKVKRKESTIIIVTQRVATVMQADQVIVLDEGRVVGIGDHASLMKDCETYREIALSQLSQEEIL